MVKLSLAKNKGRVKNDANYFVIYKALPSYLTKSFQKVVYRRMGTELGANRPATILILIIVV